jgi:hypothetical protein
VPMHLKQHCWWSHRYERKAWRQLVPSAGSLCLFIPSQPCNIRAQ